MTNTKDTAKESKELSMDWIKETGVQGSGDSDGTRPLDDYTLLKVYNPPMGTIPDIEKDGFIVQLTDDGWEKLDKELKNVQVLDLVKCYKGYAPKIENGKTVTDDEGKAITEVYYTPEVSVYDKGNIALAKSTENGPVVLGKGGFGSYIEFTTSMQLKDGTLNPLFSTIGTNSKTGEKYPISVMRQEYLMYFKMDKKLYKIRLGASYGKWKDVAEGTFLHAKNLGMKEFKKAYGTMRFEFYYLTLNAIVKKADKYKYLEWTFDSVTKDSVIDEVKKTQEAISNLNGYNFPGIETSNGIEALPYDMNRLILTTTEKVEDILVDKSKDKTDISVDDVPF